MARAADNQGCASSYQSRWPGLVPGILVQLRLRYSLLDESGSIHPEAQSASPRIRPTVFSPRPVTPAMASPVSTPPANSSSASCPDLPDEQFRWCAECATAAAGLPAATTYCVWAVASVGRARSRRASSAVGRRGTASGPRRCTGGWPGEIAAPSAPTSELVAAAMARPPNTSTMDEPLTARLARRG